MNPVSSLQHQPSPASIGLRSTRQVVAVEVKAASSRSVSRAPSPQGMAPRRSSSSQARARRRGREQLDAVLAGVAGAADQRLGPASRRSRARHPRGQRGGGDRLHDLAGVRALHGEHRVAVDPVLDRDVGSSSAWRRTRRGRLVVGGVGDRQVAIRVEAIGEEVVEHAPVLAAEHAYWAPPTAIFETSFDSSRCSNASAPGPRSRSRPCARRRTSRMGRGPPCAPDPLV